MKLFTLELMAAWQRRTAAQLADMLTAQDKMSSLTLLELFTQAQTPPNAADADQLFEVYGAKVNARFPADVELQLMAGNAAAVSALIAAGKKNTGWTPPTVDALTAVIEANTIAPTPEDVNTELNAVGFEWVDGRWVSVVV